MTTRARDRPRSGRSPAPARPRGPTRSSRGDRTLSSGRRGSREKAARSPSSVLGQAVAARPRAPGAGRDPAPAVLAGAGPGVGADSDASGLEEAQRGDQLAEGLDRAGTGVQAPAVGRVGLADAGRGEEGGLPARGPGALGGPRLGRDLDGVGAHDRGGGELQPRDGHLQAAQRDDHLDLVVGYLAAGLELGDRARRGDSSSSEKSVEPAHSRHRKTTPASSARLRGSAGHADAEAPRGRRRRARRTRSPRTRLRRSRARSAPGRGRG